MKTVTRLAVAGFAAAVVAVGNITTANAAPNVYTTPGGQILNGRLWNTTCSKYSSLVVRCKTDIWATQVIASNGKYMRVTGWTFNNLTYLPSARSMWRTNPLGRTGTWTATDGRKWKTECDTAATGRGACRTYTLTTVASATPLPGGGFSYSQSNQWVFNNIVQFAENGVKPVTTIPAHVLDQSRMDVNGLGPVSAGNLVTDLQKLGYAAWAGSDSCVFQGPTAPPCSAASSSTTTTPR